MNLDQNNLSPFTHQACQLVVSQANPLGVHLDSVIVRIQQESIVLEQAAPISEASRFLPLSTVSTSLPLVSCLLSLSTNTTAPLVFLLNTHTLVGFVTGQWYAGLIDTI
jgi:hypothetical protein